MDRNPVVVLAALAVAMLSGPVHLSAQTAPSTSQTVKFEGKGHEIGTRFTVNRQSTMEMDMAGMLMKGVDTQVFQVEVLGPQKLHIQVEKHSETNENPFAGEETQTSELQGKALTVALADGALVVTDEAGATIPDDPDAKMLRSLVASLLAADPLSRSLREAPIAVGTPRDMPRAVVQDVMGMEEEEVDWVKKFQLTLTGTEERDGTTCGVFTVAVEMEFEMDPSMPPMTTRLDGTMSVCTRTGRMVAQTMGGPLSLDTEMQEGGLAIPLKLSGKLEFVGSSTLRR